MARPSLSARESPLPPVLAEELGESDGTGVDVARGGAVGMLVMISIFGDPGTSYLKTRRKKSQHKRASDQQLGTLETPEEQWCKGSKRFHRQVVHFQSEIRLPPKNLCAIRVCS
jgi:hypothetical protein